MKNCPHLGLDEDAHTAAGFASDRNYCYWPKKPFKISADHQRTYCLTPSCSSCPVLLNNSPAPQPPAAAKNKLNFRQWILWTILASIILAGILLVNFAFNESKAVIPVETGNKSMPIPVTGLTLEITPPLPSVTDPPDILPSLTITLNPSPKPPNTLTSTVSGLSFRGYKIETPILSNPQLIIHEMAPGESYNLLAVDYHTSVEAIQRLNQAIPSPIWVGWVILIPMDSIEVSALPPFELYKINEKGITLEVLSTKLNADLDLLVKYNQAPADAILDMDTWILVPR